MSIDLGNYQSVPDFIYGITREIWEERGLGSKLARYYAPDILLRAPTGFTSSSQGVVAQTLQTLHQFPDRQLVGEDVIWRDCGDGTFLSSHRLMSIMTHSGDGSLGNATGRPVVSRIVAECWVRDQVVVEEWLVRDQAAFANCLGRTPQQLARDLTDRELRAGQPVSFFTPRHDRPSRYPATVDADPAAQVYCDGMRRIWDDKNTAAIRSLYFHGANLHLPGGNVRYGHAGIDRFVISYLASMPDARLQIDSAIVNREPERPSRLALRWSLTGTHSGFGHFGEPTGAPLYIMGLSHVHLTGGKVMSEWLLVDEVSIWKQIFAHQAGQPVA